MKSPTTKLRTLYSLGVGNVARVAWYRLRLKAGLHPVQRIRARVPEGAFFRDPAAARHKKLPCNQQWVGKQTYFGWHTIKDNQSPDWFANPFSGTVHPIPDQPWWKIPDFSAVGDIKTIWEESRLDWVLGFAQQVCQGDADALDTLNAWLADWAAKNPPYLGPNWKCGQEASIRVMHLAMAALLLEQIAKPEPALKSLIAAHCQRIAPTIAYALAQNNNHGTSEAAALFMGGNWMETLGDKRGTQWMRLGRKVLEDRARKLIEPDGSFSQQSVNYHRVMLDTYGMAEVWRRKLALPSFIPSLQTRLVKAAEWLHALTDPATGDAPNLGANDGARLLPLTDTDYRDFRPSVQLATALFQDKRAYTGEGSWNVPLQWLDIPLPEAPLEPRASTSFTHGGYCALIEEPAFVLFRYPRFRFRPGQADALHVDFWLNGHNVLRDGGSFSYADDEAMPYFKGTASHNTIQFDERDQMPRLGRFLFGEWLQAEDVTHAEKSGDETSAGAGYCDWRGATHHRTVTLRPNALLIQDKISGFERQAVLRWRLIPGTWTINGNEVTDGEITLTVSGTMPIRRLELVEGLESRYYLQKNQLPVLEVTVTDPGQLVTLITFGVRRPGAALSAELKLGAKTNKTTASSYPATADDPISS